MKLTVIVTEENRKYLADKVREAVLTASAGDVVKIAPPSRTLEQNAYMWPYLTCFSQQLEWPILVNGQWTKSKMSEYDWKDCLTGSFEGNARRMAMGTDGTGLIMLGSHTSGYNKKKFSEFIEFMNAFGSQQNVTFRLPGRTE
jgi:hypothetical protein